MIKSAGKAGIDMITVIPPEWEYDRIVSCCNRKGDSIGSKSIIIRCRAEPIDAITFIKNF